MIHVPEPGDVYHAPDRERKPDRAPLVVVLSDADRNQETGFTIVAPYSTLVRVLASEDGKPWYSATPEPGYVLWPAGRSVVTDHLEWGPEHTSIGRIEPEPLKEARKAITEWFTGELPRSVYEAAQRWADETGAEHRETVTDPKTGPEWDLD